MSPTTSERDLFWPLLVRAFGTILMFLPLSMAALGPIPKKDIAASTAFYNLTRQLGGSIGVALLTTFLGARTTFHRASLTAHLTVTDPRVQERVAELTGAMAARGADPVAAKWRALALLDGSVSVQASVKAFDDTFFVTALVIVCTVPLLFLLGKRGEGAAAAGAH